MRLVRELGIYAARYLPKTQWIDRRFAWWHFLCNHHRIPRRRMMLNDVLYHMKIDGTLLEPLRVFTTDKEYAKLFIRSTLGDDFTIPTLAVLRTRDEVEQFNFERGTVVKPTHMSGQVVFVNDCDVVDRTRVASWLTRSYYTWSREQNYRYLEPKIIVEPMLFGLEHIPLDYKVFCFNGDPKLIQVDVGRFTHHERKYFDAEWNEQPFTTCYPRAPGPIPRPGALSMMLECARKLARFFRGLVRIDLYTDGLKRVVIGEITHCPDSGCMKFVPAEAETMASELIFGKSIG